MAHLRWTKGDKPHSNASDTIYVSITEDTANLPFILEAVREITAPLYTFANRPQMATTCG